ncbi:NUDIX hydrolase [Sporolactobacillus nakayamae]|uniref:8-oxo-dGTP diphosphatase n=1 Tax=Sporolactobacillus nakayamae TaxID=269670 RepID=A0A1I2TUX2_9BACL|nr:8-oxo-dGTP diphosphatase [Sporolactobacillus nakayamae]SFG68553.1 8-oxo-dGTP diphosphatase [Sporolactobacillus nakayamae]
MLKYTLAFLKYGEKVLMINRQKAPWKGAWNGVGGKLESEESPEACVIREVWEETGIKLTAPLFRGTVTWHSDAELAQGMYVYTADITADALVDLPRSTREGILALKDIAWILSEDNFGTVPSIRFFMRPVLKDVKEDPVDYHCTFDGDHIIHTEIRPLSEMLMI